MFRGMPLRSASFALYFSLKTARSEKNSLNGPYYFSKSLTFSNIEPSLNLVNSFITRHSASSNVIFSDLKPSLAISPSKSTLS